MPSVTKQILVKIHSGVIYSSDVSQSEIVRIKDIMTKDVISMDSSRTIKDAAKIMIEKNISSLIIIQNNEPVGIIRERDFLKKVIVKDSKFSDRILDIMSTTMIYADPEQTIWDVIDLMKSRKMNSIPVISDKNEILGMVKFSDFLKAFSFDWFTMPGKSSNWGNW